MLRMVFRSVVTLGTVQVRVMWSPLRVARRSEGGLGKSSDGGCGGPIVAHAVNTNGAPRASRSFGVERLMPKEPDYQNAPGRPAQLDSKVRTTTGCIATNPDPSQ